MALGQPALFTRGFVNEVEEGEKGQKKMGKARAEDCPPASGKKLTALEGVADK